MIRRLGRTIGDTVVESVGRAVGRSQEQRPLSADLLESEDAYLVVFDMPGAERDDVQVRFEDGEVLVRGDRFREFHEGFEMRFPGRGLSLEGSVALPEGAAVRADDATATLKKNGTLQVTIPKAAQQAGADTDSDAGSSESDADGDASDDEESGDESAAES